MRTSHAPSNINSEHLITDLLKAIHGQMEKHPGITKMIQECRSKYNYPGLAKRIKQWVMQ